jgi:hypothetical protein
MILVVHPGSRIQILTYPSRIQGSKRHRISDPEHCFFPAKWLESNPVVRAGIVYPGPFPDSKYRQPGKGVYCLTCDMMAGSAIAADALLLALAPVAARRAGRVLSHL